MQVIFVVVAEASECTAALASESNGRNDVALPRVRPGEEPHNIFGVKRTKILM